MGFCFAEHQPFDSACRSVNDFDWSKQLRYYWAAEEVGAPSSSPDCLKAVAPPWVIYAEQLRIWR